MLLYAKKKTKEHRGKLLTLQQKEDTLLINIIRSATYWFLIGWIELDQHFIGSDFIIKKS